MVLGISEDFTSKVVLDSQLKDLPSSGLYLNSGVHPSITVENLLEFLPKTGVLFDPWDATKTYNKFERNRDDIVETGSGELYQSLQNGNINNNPSSSSAYWLNTNIESLRIKSFFEKVKDKVYSDLSLTKRLINNQYIYEEGSYEKLLPENYAAWVLEPKGSDYVTIKINEISLQKKGVTPVNLYIINQNRLIETIQLTPDDGRLSFSKTDITLSGKGKFLLAIDSTEVIVGNRAIDPLRFNGFVAYTGVGTGISPETARYTYGTTGNGLGINVSAYLDATLYIDNNLSELGNYVRAVFELMVFEMFLHNSNNRSNRVQRIQMNDQMLIAELKDMNAETVVKRYHREKKRAIGLMQRTFDTQLNEHDGIEVTIGSV